MEISFDFLSEDTKGSFSMDIPGKDTWKHRQAGAKVVMITSPTKTAMIEERYTPAIDDIDGLMAFILDYFQHHGMLGDRYDEGL